MAYDDLFNPAVYKCWNEAIIKEKKIRVKWQEEYGSKINMRLLKEDGEADAPCTCPVGTSPEEKSEMFWPREGAIGTGTLISVCNPSKDMIPPTPTVKGILYEGISKDGRGRHGYLKRRYQEDPEQRYRSQVCTNWKYGWNHGKENELSCKDEDNCGIRKKAFGLECV